MGLIPTVCFSALCAGAYYGVTTSDPVDTAFDAAILVLADPYLLVTVTYMMLGIYGFAVLLPSLSVLVRRLQDTNRTAMYLLLGLIPLFGAIALLFFTLLDSQPEENQYGPNPKAAD